VRKTGRTFPKDPFEQFRRVMSAVLASPTAERVRHYGRALGLPVVKGALIILATVFGNNSRQNFGYLFLNSAVH
jgi:hypothetical protein